MDFLTTTAHVRNLSNDLDMVEDIHGQSVVLYVWGDGITAVRLELTYRDEADYGSERHDFVAKLTHDELVYGTVDTDTWLSDTFAEAAEWIRSIPTKAERDHNDFIRSVGRLIDKGREVGIDVNFLNPLTDMMMRLSENILEDKRGQH